MARAVLEETGLLPHLNPGLMGAEDYAALRPYAASMGIMLESASERLCERGGPHFGSPDKRPRSEEHMSEVQSLMRISYAVLCLKKTKTYCPLLDMIRYATLTITHILSQV